jgi:hypothetical protein
VVLGGTCDPSACMAGGRREGGRREGRKDEEQWGRWLACVVVSGCGWGGSGRLWVEGAAPSAMVQPPHPLPHAPSITPADRSYSPTHNI